MIETDLSPIHSLPSGLCEDPSAVATTLIGRIAHDDGNALADLHAMWSPAFLGIASRMLGERRAAEDAVQDTFARIWRDATDYDPHEAPPLVWGFALLRRFCLDRLRAGLPAKRDSLRRLPPTVATTPVAKPDEPRVMAADDFRRVRAALDHLSPEERSSLESAVFLQYAQANRAKPLEPHIGTLKHHLRQALKNIRNHLSRYEL